MASFLGRGGVRTALRLRAGKAAGGLKAAGGGGKKKGRGGGGGDSAPLPVVPKEQRVHVTLGANILKEGKDPAILPDSEYPDWLFRLLDKPQSLSELRKKDPEQMEIPELRRLLKLDNRRKIKENNQLRSKD